MSYILINYLKMRNTPQQRNTKLTMGSPVDSQLQIEHLDLNQKNQASKKKGNVSTMKNKDSSGNTNRKQNFTRRLWDEVVHNNSGR